MLATARLQTCGANPHWGVWTKNCEALQRSDERSLSKQHATRDERHDKANKAHNMNSLTSKGSSLVFICFYLFWGVSKLLKTRLWRGFGVRLPVGSHEPTRQRVAVLVDSDLHCANSNFDAFGPKVGGSRIF